MKTEALWYLGERKLKLDEAVIPDPGPDDVLVEMEVCGVCGWDILAYSGRFAKFHAYPFRAGHEGIGRVRFAGSHVTDLPEGTRVACHELPIDSREGGLMARHAVRPRSKVTPLPESPIPVEFWILEPIACVVNGVMHAGIEPGSRVALVGSGYMGLLLMQLLNRTLAGAVTVFETDPARLALAKRMAASPVGWEFKTPQAEGPSAVDRGAFDVVIETAGAASALHFALALAKPYAIIENFAWHHHRHEFDLDEWHVKGWRILNIQPQMNPGFDRLFAASATLVEIGAVTNKGLVTHIAPFERAEEVYRAGLDRTGGYIKGVIDFRRA